MVVSVTEGELKLILAVDIGGTKTGVGLISTSGEILGVQVEDTCQSGPQDGVAHIARIAREVLFASGLGIEMIQCVGVGLPAVLAPETDFVIWALNLNGWRDVDFRTMLEGKLGLPVYLEYDGHTAVLGEWWVGAGKGYRSLVDIIIGTGIGGGMILNGQLVRGQDRLAGAAGWFALTSQVDLVDERSRLLGFWESKAAGPGIALRAQALLSQQSGSMLLELRQQGPLDSKMVFSTAQQGDPLAMQVVDEFVG